MRNRITVGLRYDVYSKLRERGKFGETFSDVVMRLLDELQVKKGGSLDVSFPGMLSSESGIPQQ